MSNDVALVDTNKLASLADPKIIEAAAKNAALAAGGLETGGDGIPLLKMSQDGEWTVGMDDQPVPEGFRFAADPFQICTGWTCWKGGRPIENVMVPVLEGQPPAENTLPDHGPFKGAMEGWKKSVEFIAAGVDAPIKVRYNSASMGAARAVNKMIGQMLVQIGKQDGNVVPVFEVNSESYYNKNYQKDIYNPLLTIVGFADAELKVSPISAILPAADDVVSDVEDLV